MTNLFDLTGKVAIVTGGNGGIGLGIARGLAQVGAKLAIIARNTEKSQLAARALTQETGVTPLVLTADVANPDQVASATAEVLMTAGHSGSIWLTSWIGPCKRLKFSHSGSTSSRWRRHNAT